VLTSDRRVSSYAGGPPRRNTRSSLNAVSSGRSALNTRSQLDRDPPLRHRYLPNVGVSGGYQEQMLANSTTTATAAPPQPPDAALIVVASTGNEGDRPAGRGCHVPPASDRRPVTVAVLSERRSPSTLPVDHPWHTPRPRSPPSNDKEHEAVASAETDVASRNNHHICDSAVQQQEQQHIV